MESLFTFNSPPGPCGYRPDQTWQLHYEVVGQLTPGEYRDRMRQGWRRFGFSLFRPECPSCRMCQPIRVPTATFSPDRSQRRAWKSNASDVRVTVGVPCVNRDKLRLYDRFHRSQHATKGWPSHEAENATDYAESFVENPFPTQEWCYFLGTRLIGVGYVDALPDAFSAIYFFHDPDQFKRSLGTFNVLSVVAKARERGLEHVYLGYFVEGCRSLEYKSRFTPNETRSADGQWRAFR
jgi:arginine-tRNA-protein transferase